MTRLDKFYVKQDNQTGTINCYRGSQSYETVYFLSHSDRLEICDSIDKFSSPRLRRDALSFYMSQTVLGASVQNFDAETIFESIKKCPVSHHTLLSNDPGRDAVFSRLPVSNLGKLDLSEETLVNQLMEAMLDTARDLVHEFDDIFLETSGGIDSTLMGAIIRKVMPAQKNFTSVALIYPYYEFRREQSYIAMAVNALQTRVKFVDGSNSLPFSRFHLVRPPSEPSLIIAGLQQHHDVLGQVNSGALLLNGNGGDRLFTLGPSGQSLNLAGTSKFDWMSERFYRNIADRVSDLASSFQSRGLMDDYHFISGANIDDRWMEREYAALLGVRRTHLFLNEDVVPLVYALWSKESEKKNGKWILKKHFNQLIPESILNRPGKVCYNGLYPRGYRKSQSLIEALIYNFKDHLEESGVIISKLLQHVDRISKGHTAGDLEVSVVVTYLIWLNAWLKAGRNIIN